MSAREDLVRILSYTDSGVLDDMFEYDKNIGACAEKILNDHAHELAERIRTENPSPLSDWAYGVDWAADLIDPEVENR